jgi:hypothetical protein
MEKTIRKTIEDTYAAAAFAEMAEYDTAMKIAGIRSIAQKVVDKARHLFDTHMTAVCFAEAGCFDTAGEVMGTQAQEGRANQKPSLDTFLESVGLQNARVCYGMVRV